MTRFPLYCGNAEPSIDELLDDPIAQLLMRRDGVAPEACRAVMRRAAKAGLGAPDAAPASLGPLSAKLLKL